MADVTKTLKDVAYIAVGLGVIGFQKAQVRRNELTKQLDAQFEETRKLVKTQLGETRDQVEKLVKQIEETVEPLLDQVEEQVPVQAKAYVKPAREVAKDVQEQVRSFVGRAA
jgi:ribosome recycling factor